MRLETSIIVYPEMQDGYTLLEIIVAISILSIALIPLMEMLPSAMVLETQLERETKAAFLAQQKLEEVKGKALYNFDQDRSEAAAAFPSPDSHFKYTVSDDQGTEIKEIEVNVWHDENSNGKMDSYLIGIPKEGYGFSNNPYSRFGEPELNEILFEVEANTATTIELETVNW